MHYARWYVHGDPMVTLRIVGADAATRLWAGVQRPGKCWPWTGGNHRFGYGVIRVGDDTILTHRLAWTVTHGPIPDGMDVCHHCDNPPCCKALPDEFGPACLFLGTREDNVHDMIAKGRAAWQKATHSED
jgi:hypothetical protein